VLVALLLCLRLRLLLQLQLSLLLLLLLEELHLLLRRIGLHRGRHGWAVDEVAAAIAIGLLLLLRKVLSGVLLVGRECLSLRSGLGGHVTPVVFLHQLLLLLLLLWRYIADLCLCSGAVERLLLLLLLLLRRLLHSHLLRLLGSHAGGKLHRRTAVHLSLLLALLCLHGVQSALLKQVLLLLLLLRGQVLVGHVRRCLHAHHGRALHVGRVRGHRHARLERYVAVGRDVVDERRRL